MIKSLFKDKGKEPQEENLSGVLRVIGDRTAGKTTYMAALARWPNSQNSRLVEGVTASNKDGEELIKKARDILEQGEPMKQTPLLNNVYEMKDYSLRITLKKELVLDRKKSLVNLDISCKDYSGEFFSELLNQTDSPLFKDYLEDCLLASGILLLIDGTAHQKDAEYARAIEKLLVQLDRFEEEIQKRRIALVLSKCELVDLWINRHRPKYLAKARFRETCSKLEFWERGGSGSIDYFVVSAFGVLGNRFPRPNSLKIERDRGGISSVLEEPKRWRPFGLVSPIYWLCTGKRNQELDKD
ncbi:MAG: hypothetical protein SXA11_03225 [Cyanobacteriota bacterium]|nr:hypothetical protein [Cyanobacteriota bacterium]